MSTDSVILRLLRSILVNMGVVMIALLVALSLIEGSARIIKGRPLLLWMNFTEAHLDFLRQIQPGEYHHLLGWIRKENYAASNNYWGIRIETIRHGLRFTGDFDSSERDTILAVGDSFTFGDEVSDKDTWPFILNSQVKEYVLNGGVFGYGIDQTYLRLTELMKHYRLAIIIFSFIPEDIIRAQMSKRHAQKPFFVVNRGEIELKNVPVPQSVRETHEISMLTRIIGYSFFLDGIIRKTFLIKYFYPANYFDSNMEHNDGEIIACWIMGQLAAIASEGVKILVLAQYTYTEVQSEMSSIPATNKVLNCAREHDLSVIDLFPLMKEMRPEHLKTLFNHEMSGDMSPAGNRFVAQQIRRHLRKQ